MSLSRLHAQLVSRPKPSSHRPSQKMSTQPQPQRLLQQPTLTQANSGLSSTRIPCRSPQGHYTRSVIASSSSDHGIPDHSRCLYGARADVDTLKLLQVLELHTFVSDKKLNIPKLRHKDGASDTLGLQNHFDNPTDIINAIVKLPEFTLVSKSTIEEIVEKVGSQPINFLPNLTTHFASTSQRRQQQGNPSRRPSVHARLHIRHTGVGGFFSNILFTYMTTAWT
jgi:hypothetical protein